MKVTYESSREDLDNMQLGVIVENLGKVHGPNSSLSKRMKFEHAFTMNERARLFIMNASLFSKWINRTSLPQKHTFSNGLLDLDLIRRAVDFLATI